MSNIIEFPKRGDSVGHDSEDPTSQILQFIESECDLKWELVEVAKEYDVDEFVFRYCEFVNRNRLKEPWPSWEAAEKDIDWGYIQNALRKS